MATIRKPTSKRKNSKNLGKLYVHNEKTVNCPHCGGEFYTELWVCFGGYINSCIDCGEESEPFETGEAAGTLWVI